ncbi:hypothetical protein FQZ97_801820 [compost metagenome]
MPAVLGTHRSRNFALFQRVQRLFERGLVDARTRETEVAAVGCGAGIVGELLGQGSEVLALVQALLDLLDLGLGLLFVQLVTDLHQDVGGLTLLGKVADLFLVLGLEVFILGFDLAEEGRLLQFDVLDHHLLGAHELIDVTVVVRLDLVVGNADRSRIGLDCQGREIAGLLFQAGEGFNFSISHETAAGQTGAQLADEHFLLQHLTELQAVVVHLANDLVEAVGVELAVHLKFRRLQNELVNGALREGEIGILSTLQQELALDQAFQCGFAQQLVVQQGSIEVLAQLLLQLTALHVHSFAQLVQGDFVTVDLSRVLAIAGGIEDGVEAGQRQQHDDDANNGFGNPPL